MSMSRSVSPAPPADEHGSRIMHRVRHAGIPVGRKGSGRWAVDPSRCIPAGPPTIGTLKMPEITSRRIPTHQATAPPIVAASQWQTIKYRLAFLPAVIAARCQNAYPRSFPRRQRHAFLHGFGEVDPIPFNDVFLDYLVVFDAGWLQYLHPDLVVPFNFAHG